jgi:hypothetical protein
MVKGTLIKKVVKILRKVNVVFINILNFILLLPVYFLGVGLCRLIWEMFVKKNFHRNISHWIKSDELEKYYEKYKKQF